MGSFAGSPSVSAPSGGRVDSAAMMASPDASAPGVIKATAANGGTDVVVAGGAQVSGPDAGLLMTGSDMGTGSGGVRRGVDENVLSEASDAGVPDSEVMVMPDGALEEPEALIRPAPCDGPDFSDTVMGFRDKAYLGLDLDGWASMYVNAIADPGGDGTQARPFTTLSEAESAIEGPTLIFLAPGIYAGGLTFRSSVALLGAGPEVTRIEGPVNGPTLELTGHRETIFAVAWLHLDGGTAAFQAATAGELHFVHTLLSGGTGATVRLSAVNSAAFLCSEIRGSGEAQAENGRDDAHLQILSSGVSLYKSKVTGAHRMGILTDFADSDQEECTASPVCPFSSFLFLEDSQIYNVAARGEARYGSWAPSTKFKMCPQEKAQSVHSIQSFARIWDKRALNDRWLLRRDRERTWSDDRHRGPSVSIGWSGCA